MKVNVFILRHCFSSYVKSCVSEPVMSSPGTNITLYGLGVQFAVSVTVPDSARSDTV